MAQLRRRLDPVVLAGLLLLAGCSGFSLGDRGLVPRRTILDADRVALPTEAVGDGLYVDVRINGAGPFSLMVDTGCTCIILTQNAADAAGLKPLPGPGFVAVNAAGVLTKGKTAWVERLECGGLRLEEFTTLVGSDADFETSQTLVGRRFAGMIGMATLKDLVVEMDFPGKQVTVVRRGTSQYPADRAVDYRDELPHVTLQVGGKEIPALLDTGSGGALEVPKLDGLPLVYSKTKSIGTGAVFGKTSGRRGEDSQVAGEVRMGAVTWINPPIAGMAHDSKVGRIGVAVLGTWKLAIDQQAHRIYFLGAEPRRVWAEAKPPDPRFALGFFADIEGTGLRLLEVDAGGGADLAGLRAGDLIVTMDGQPAATMAVVDYRSRLRVQREGTEFETTLIFAPDYTPRQTLLAADRVALPTASSRGGTLVVEARINGAGPFRFLVSTGVIPLRVGPHVVEAAGIKSMPGWLAEGQPSTAKVVWVDRFESQGLQLKGLAAVVSDPTALSAASALFGPLDGFLGLEALKDVVIELDFPKKQLTAVRSGSATYQEERAVPYEGTVPRVVLDVGGRAQAALIDAGSNGGFDLPLLDVVPLLHPKVKSDGIGFGRLAERSERGQLAGEVRLGPVTWVRPPIAGRRLSRIGALALSAWKLAIDQHAQKIYFLDGNLRRTAAEIRPAAEPQLKSGYFAKLEARGLRLAEVDAGGAFDRAGLRAGDLVLAVDNVPAADYARQTGAFLARTNPRPKLRVERDGSEFMAEVVLAREEPPK